MLGSHLEGAPVTLAPGSEQEPEGAAAFTEAHVLKGRQLVDRGDGKDGAGEPPPAGALGQLAAEGVPAKAKQPVRNESSRPPHEQVRRGEKERATPAAPTGHARV